MSYLLNETNIEITEITIPDDAILENVDMFVQTMGFKINDLKSPNPKEIIKAINDRKIVIKGTRNPMYAMAKQFGWKLHRLNPPVKAIIINQDNNDKP